MLLGCNDFVTDPANSSCALTYYSMYNQRYDLIPFMISFRAKGGESSSQFRRFKIAKIELLFLIFFVLILGLRLHRYSTNTKRYPPEKVFGNSEFCSSHQNHSSLNYFGGKNKTQSFQKTFSGGYLFVFVEYLCNRSPKIKTKNIKNYSSILAIVNQWNWLDDLPPLNHFDFLEVF